jgi:hypothetical protein
MEKRNIKKEEIFTALEHGEIKGLSNKKKLSKRLIKYFELEIIVDVSERGKWKLITVYKK